MFPNLLFDAFQVRAIVFAKLVLTSQELVVLLAVPYKSEPRNEQQTDKGRLLSYTS